MISTTTRNVASAKYADIPYACKTTHKGKPCEAEM